MISEELLQAKTGKNGDFHFCKKKETGIDKLEKNDSESFFMRESIDFNE